MSSEVESAVVCHCVLDDLSSCLGNRCCDGVCPETVMCFPALAYGLALVWCSVSCSVDGCAVVSADVVIGAVSDEVPADFVWTVISYG